MTTDSPRQLPDEDDWWEDPEDHTPLELDDDSWDVFLPDDPFDPLPEPHDFWIEDGPSLDVCADCAARCGVC